MQPRPLLILDARRLREMFVRMSADAAINHGAYLLYFRDEPDNDARAAEAKDLIAAYRPTMNAKFAASQSRHRDRRRREANWRSPTIVRRAPR